MPRWKPEPEWKGLDCFIIGGGPSLKTFDWSLLKSKDVMTVGVNDAFLLGNDVSKICIFGDLKWFELHVKALEHYQRNGGVVFTSCPQLQKSKCPWLWLLMRRSAGFHDDAVGWCANTGATAINLALMLGAVNIYLLGFDMHLSDKNESNWHKNVLIDKKADGSIYRRFLREMANLNDHLTKKFPGRSVINVTNDSALNVFPKVNLDLFFAERSRK